MLLFFSQRFCFIVKFSEERNRILNCLTGNAERESQPFWAAKAAGRNHKHMMLDGQIHEVLCRYAERGLEEQVKSSAGIGKGIADFAKCFAEDLSIMYIVGNVGCNINAAFHHHLEKGGGANICQVAGCAAQSGPYIVEVIDIIVSCDKADTLTGQGK